VVASAVCLLGALALIGLAYTLQSVSLYDLLIDVPLGLKLLLGALLLSVPLSLALPYFALRGFETEKPALLARTHYWLLAGTALLTLIVAHHWNLLGFHY
jgi:hypothetical protein